MYVCKVIIDLGMSIRDITAEEKDFWNNQQKQYYPYSTRKNVRYKIVNFVALPMRGYYFRLEGIDICYEVYSMLFMENALYEYDVLIIIRPSCNQKSFFYRNII